MARAQRVRRAFEVARAARRGKLTRVLREVGVVGGRPATREGAQEFRKSLEELGTTYVKLGQLLSSRPDLLPDVYIDELAKLVDDAPPVPSRRSGARSTKSSAQTRSRGSTRSLWRARRSRRSTRRCSRKAAGLLVASALLARVHTFEWVAIVGFAVAAILGLYMVWKIIRTPGEL